MPLTGKFAFRKSFWGRIVLQVEEEVKPFWRRSKPGPVKQRWRDATLMDLTTPEMRALLDMRSRPHFRPASVPVPQDDAALARPAPAQKADGEPRRMAH